MRVEAPVAGSRAGAEGAGVGATGLFCNNTMALSATYWEKIGDLNHTKYLVNPVKNIW
jgi:hypothetical protein